MPSKKMEVIYAAVCRWRDKNRGQTRAWCAKYNRTLGGRFARMKRGAKKREIPFELTKEQYANLVIGAICHYCGGILPEVGSGADRKNSSAGYSVENCVPCCRNCNSIRGADLISYKEMLEVAKLLRKLRTKANAGDDFEEHF